ncbi:hypothetical protein P8V03_15950 [Clostridium sp. A1-XYC3]|uniref:Uncharacterized protein n=1 Tax=Clostridium tanneri TaxID=3037988 RepID=A0ABU4JXH2_9CLOT|nr:hypothetical protein [Clostridium sp. A1-XYC3]MDW8802641.1 hypothetical protein [Clostridium sp. A1-XYC3]
MKKIEGKENIEVIFKNNEESTNKLINFIINKILDNYEVFKVILDEVEDSNYRKDGRKHDR